MEKAIIVFFVITLFLSSNILAQNSINEDALFSDPASIIGNEKIIDNNINDEEEKKTIGISGEARSVIEFRGTRDFIKKGDNENNTLSSYIIGNLLFDARLKKGTKCLANMETQYNLNSKNDDSTNNFDSTDYNDISNDTSSSYSQDSYTSKDADFFLKEFFIDFNIKNKVYFRTGKQVLQWGRCYLWNPSDLINIEKRTFKEKIGSREGVYGMKIHIPFGTKYNIYSFLDTKDADNDNKIGGACKFEFVIGKTEMAFSAWSKKKYRPVYTYDFSTRILGLDAFGEAAFSYGDNYEKFKIEQTENAEELTKYKEEHKWIPRVCIDFGKSFDFKDISDRISINVEFYYNHTGLTDNIFSDPNKTYPVRDSDSETDSSGTQKEIMTITEFMLHNNLYEPNNLSKYYFALFTNTRKFILSDMNLILNLIGNLNDNSCILTSGISYSDINNFSIGFYVYSYIGKSNREYTFANNGITTQLTIGVLF